MNKLKKNFQFIIWLSKPYFKYTKKYAIIAVVFFVAIIPLTRVLNVIFPEIVMNMINWKQTIVMIAIVVLIFQVILFAIPAFEDYYNVTIRDPGEATVEAKINQEIYEQAVSIDYKFIDDPEYFKSYTWTIEHYAEKSSEAFSLLTNALSSLVVILSLITILSTTNPFIILIVLVGVILRTYGYVKYNEYYVERDRKTVVSNQMLNYFHRIFYMKEYSADLKSTNLKSILMRKYQTTAEEKKQVLEEAAKPLSRWGILCDFLYHLTMFIVILLIVKSIYDGQIVEVASYITIMLAIENLDSYLYQIFELFQNSQKLCMYAEEIHHFFEMDTSIENRDSQITPVDIPFSIDIDHVSFNYPNTAFYLNDINMHIQKGQKIAIVGRNGSGKTTLVKLLLRLYEPDSGEIKINGIPIDQYNVKRLRLLIGTVFQSSNIYAMTIKENIELYNKNEKTSSYLEEMLEKNECNIDSQLTKEFDESGIVLSKGEEQKVALARVMNGTFGLLLLDEPSSALDPIAEADMMKSLSAASKNTTTIMIAHRLSTVTEMDCIYVFDDGEIKEEGTHKELMNQNGLYSEMFMEQAKNYQSQ